LDLMLAVTQKRTMANYCQSNDKLVEHITNCQLLNKNGFDVTRFSEDLISYGPTLKDQIKCLPTSENCKAAECPYSGQRV
jgi:hypothetical protein